MQIRDALHQVENQIYRKGKFGIFVIYRVNLPFLFILLYFILFYSHSNATETE